MKKIIVFCMSVLLPFLVIGQDKITVNVHPGVELLTIVQLLADKYNDPNPSSYSNEVMDYFGKFKDHPAVKKARSFSKTYADMPELGWCLSGFPDIKIYEPTENIDWYKYNGKENVLEYLRLCKAFCNDTHFWDFYRQHQDRYKKWGEPITAKIDTGKLIEKLQGFYRYDADVHWYICLDPLNGWGSHAIITKVLNPQFSDWVVYNTGYLKRGSDGNTEPSFGLRNFENLVWHEGSHIYLDGLMKKYEVQIAQLSYLFNKDDDGMKSNNITNWAYCFDENVVRSITAALYKKYRTERQFKRQVATETSNDFIYVEDLTPFIYERYVNSTKYKTFADFFPEVVKFLKNKYPQKA